MRILILEPHATGHHASYLRWLVQAAVREQLSVVIATTPDALRHPSMAGAVSEAKNVEFHTLDDVAIKNRTAVGVSQLLRREFQYWLMFRRAAFQVTLKMHIDAIILPYIDYCFYPLALLGPPFRKLPWCGISMRLAVTREVGTGGSRLPLKWRLARRILGNPHLQRLFVINPSVEELPLSWISTKLQSKLSYLPDPAEVVLGGSRSEARATLGLAESDIAILVFGSIDERKGVDALLDGIRRQSELSRYVVVLAGKQSGMVPPQGQSSQFVHLCRQNRVIALDRFLTDEDKTSVMRAADVVWVGYRNHPYMSGVLVLAGKAGLPVVGTADGEIGRLIIKHRMGVVARIDRPEEISAALSAMLDSEERSQMGYRARAAFEGHTVERFGASVLSALHLPM